QNNLRRQARSFYFFCVNFPRSRQRYVTVSIAGVSSAGSIPSPCSQIKSYSIRCFGLGNASSKWENQKGVVTPSMTHEPDTLELLDVGHWANYTVAPYRGAVSAPTNVRR